VAEDRTSRRRFLAVAARGSAVLGAARLGVACSGAASLHGSYAVGNITSFPAGTLNAAPNAPLAIGRDAAGIWAMSLICTHAGCDMATDGSVSASRVTCSCHGSEFDEHGNVLEGPARAALPCFEVTLSLTSGDITVDTDVEVPSSTRAAVAGA
jgi:Rieske Fe-S protein